MISTPSFIDLHTHTRYPDNDNFQYREIEKAAKYGGYSDILAMANSEIIIDSIENLSVAKEIDKKLNLKIHRVAALSKNLNGNELVNYKEFADKGIRIFSDDGKSLINDELADLSFKTLAKLDCGIFQHCELNCHSNPGDIAPPKLNNELIEIYEEEELKILERDLKLVEKYKTRYHAQHISTKKSLDMISRAKKLGLPVTTEVSPHHLLLSNENITFTDGTYKMYPPIRSESDRNALVQGLKDGVIDVVATDHAPHPKESKNINFKQAARGVVGLESTFPVLFSSGLFSLDELITFLHINPKKILKQLGYRVAKTNKITWLKTETSFTTKTSYKNSTFENTKVLIRKELFNV